MNFKLITAYPWWFILFCIIFGLLITTLLYFRKGNKEYTAGIKWLLAAIRFISITLTAFLLISPMVRTIKRSIVKPSIIIGIDNSSSITMNADSGFYKTEFISKIESLQKDLGDDYDVHVFNFGDVVKMDEIPDFSDQLTDISSLFSEINTRYYNRNIGAVILASDGIFNSGSDPLYNVRNSKYPVYTINLGDTTSRKDIRVQNISYNKTAFKGNQFPVEITIQAMDLVGEKSKVTISEDNSVLFTQEFNVSSSNQIITIPAFIEAKEIGLKRLQIAIEPLEGEVNKSNNGRDIYIEIKESKLKVALITDSPHPDIAALQRVFENSNNFEVELFLADEFSSRKPESYSLIILNQLPSLKNAYTLQLNNITKSGTPLLLIVGSQSNIQLVNSLSQGLLLTNFKGSFNESVPSLNSAFSLFLYTEAQKKLIEMVPPLISPFASYNIANSVHVFAHQQIGNTKTEMPLILFNESMEKRIGIIVGEGIWKWRMFDFIQNSTHSNFDELMQKMFQYLTAQTDKSKFRVDWKNFYVENENIEFGALLFNDSYEPINEPEITLEIVNEANKKFDYLFSSEDQRYTLKLGSFQPGMYTFQAKVELAGKEMIKRGSFVVTAVKLEDLNLVANHKMLNTIALESGGKSYFPSDFDAIADQLKTREDVKPMVYSRKYYMELIDFYPIMILLFLLLGAEWFLRKYLGGY